MLRPMAVPDVTRMSSLRARGVRGNGAGRNVRTSPQLIADAPHARPHGCRRRVESRLAAQETVMKTERPAPNAELNQTFEPLRLVFAISALLLGIIASAHF